MSATAPERTSRPALASAFADVLSYPHESPAAAARWCADVAGAYGESARAHLERFAAIAATAELGDLQEAYSAAFDLALPGRSEEACHLYVGHYLFDETHKRGAFILELKRRFGAEGFEDASDLADHLLVLMRFLAFTRDELLADELVDDAILPALARSRPLREGTESAPPTARASYLGLLDALEQALASGRPEPADAVPVEVEREWARDRDSLGIDRAWCGH